METNAPLDIGIVTDEVSRDLAEALGWARERGLRRFELREGGEERFPGFTEEEIRIVEEALQDGCRVTAVSPGILKGPADDPGRIRRELEETLPRALELAERFDCRRVIVFGFERYEGEPEKGRSRAKEAFRKAAEQADAAGMEVVIENEPNFWVDRPSEEADLLTEIDHPALGANWDPANTIWGGGRVERAGFRKLKPFIRNVHVKDYDPESADAPWKPVGQGRVPWRDFLDWLVAETSLEHVTIETHCKPLKENSQESLRALRELLVQVQEGRRPASA